MDVDPWREAAGLLDERIFVNVDREVARDRLVRRHLHTGVETEREAAERRGAQRQDCRPSLNRGTDFSACAVDLSDMLNGDYIREHLFEPTLQVSSLEDSAFAAALAQ